MHCRRSTAGMHSTTTIESGTQVYCLCKYNPSKATCDILTYACMLSCRAVIAVLHPAGIAWCHGQDHWFSHRVYSPHSWRWLTFPYPQHGCLPSGMSRLSTAVWRPDAGRTCPGIAVLAAPVMPPSHCGHHGNQKPHPLSDRVVITGLTVSVYKHTLALSTT